MTYINPRVDLVFKKIFGVEENKDLLISLINSIVSEQDQVTDLTLLNPYNNKNFANDKLSILDVKAKDKNGRMFNIEIQVTDEADYDKRALYYWAKLYTEQLQGGMNYRYLSKAIGIHILNFTSIPHAPKYHNVFHVREKDSDILYFHDLELHTIELGKFSSLSEKEGLVELAEKVKSSIDMWAAFLTRHDLLKGDNLPDSLNTPELHKALDVLQVMNFGDEEREAYEARLKWLRIEANTVQKYEDQAREEGIEIGEQIGREEEKMQIAVNMLKENAPLDFIHRVTNLSMETLVKLQWNTP